MPGQPTVQVASTVLAIEHHCTIFVPYTIILAGLHTPSVLPALINEHTDESRLCTLEDLERVVPKALRLCSNIVLGGEAKLASHPENACCDYLFITLANVIDRAAELYVQMCKFKLACTVSLSMHMCLFELHKAPGLGCLTMLF